MNLTYRSEINNSKKIKKYYNIAKTKLFPLTRSLTGEGVRTTLKIIRKEFSNLKIKRFKSGTKVFDWNIPKEWNVSDAYVIDKYKLNQINNKYIRNESFINDKKKEKNI